MNRRTFLTTAAVSTAGAAAFGATPAIAATDVPAVSTRGHFDDDGDLVDGYGRYDYDTDGTVPGVGGDCVADATVMVHGWWKKGDDEEAEAAAEAKFEECDAELDDDGYRGVVLGYSWDNDVDSDAWDYGWSTAKDVAEENGYKLAQFLLDYKNACDGGTIRLIGHSLGARVIFSALSVLDGSSYWNDPGYAVQSVHFIGGAVDNEYPTTKHEPGYRAVTDQTDRSYNYHSEDDEVLEWAYSSFEWDRALGETGAESGHDVPSNYADVDVTDQVGDDHSGYLEHCADEIVAHMS